MKVPPPSLSSCPLPGLVFPFLKLIDQSLTSSRKICTIPARYLFPQNMPSSHKLIRPAFHLPRHGPAPLIAFFLTVRTDDSDPAPHFLFPHYRSRAGVPDTPTVPSAQTPFFFLFSRAPYFPLWPAVTPIHTFSPFHPFGCCSHLSPFCSLPRGGAVSFPLCLIPLRLFFCFSIRPCPTF